MKLDYSLNEHYFDNIDCDEKAYWLGFLFADGAISNNTIHFGQSKESRKYFLFLPICK